MKKNGGLLAGLLAVLTLVGVSNLPTKSSESPAAAESKKPAVASARMASASRDLRPYSPCTEIAKRLRRFVGTDKPIDSWELPDSCYGFKRPDGLEKAHLLPGVRLAVATVPNPVSTHLPLLFDRIVDTIQQAAQDDNYSYDASWFPWEASSKTYPLLFDQKEAEELAEIQQSQPGVMVFRRAPSKDQSKPYNDGLVILLVGEQPTGGISDDQFEHALDWVAQLGGLSDGTLRILGPTFSGSLPSLQRVLDVNPTKPKVYSTLSVSSGTVSSADAYKKFKEWIDGRGGSKFWTATESDSVMVARFCEYITEQRYETKYVAFLSEDETAFGRTESAPLCGDAISLYYPRDIATLRSAYAQQSILNPSKPEPSASAPSATLRGDLSEPANNDHDTVRSYGGQLTPLAQESILFDIANRLADKRIQFVILRSTNSLDQIFLSQFLRRSYPGGRVVIDGADLLFDRGAEGKSLRGVMLLSTYPLLVQGQDWIPSLLNKPTKSYRTFGQDTAEGVYIAARELFRDPQKDSGGYIPDYGLPAWAAKQNDNKAENQRPATWITVIARRQFWPLAALNSNTLDPKEKSKLDGTLLPFPDRGDYPDAANAGDVSPLYLPTTMWMFFLACILWNIAHLYLCSNGSMMGSPRARAYFAPIPKWQHSALISFGSALLAMLAVVAAAASGLFSWWATPHPYRDSSTGILLAVFLLASVTLAVTACKKNYGLDPVRPSATFVANISRWRSVASRYAIIALAIFVLVQYSLVYKLSKANSIPAYWRSVNLTSGVSGLLPEILLIAGAYLWFWFNLRGLVHFGEDRPRLPELALPKLHDGTPMMRMFSEEGAGRPVENAALPLTRQYLKRLLAVFIITVIVCWVALGDLSVRTLGELSFGRLIFWWICLCIAVIIADGIQTWQAWNELRQLLVYLDRLPLRRTLGALKGLAWGSIWNMSGNVLQERYRVISLQMESLTHLKNTIAVWAPKDSAEENHRSALLQKVRNSPQSKDRIDEFVNWFVTLKKDQPVTDLTAFCGFQWELRSIAGLVLNNILLPAWGTETNSLIFGRFNPDAKSGEAETTQLDIPMKELEPHVRAAEEFFVLHYLAFIQNILGRIRTIALGSLWLFVGTTLAVSSYPFDPMSVLGGIFLTVFVIVGGLTVLVYSQMSRDATLSHITNTQPGQLGSDFWLRLVGFGVGPLIGLLTTLFPSITDFMFSWLQPSVQALK